MPPEKDVRILVVDDEPLMRDMIQDVISHEGLCATMAADCSEARALAEKQAFDVLITDINLPGESGIDLAKNFRRVSPATGVIVITAFPNSERVKMMEEIEVSSFLIKPFTVKQLKFSLLGAIEKVRTTHEDGRIATTVDTNRDLGLVGTSHYMQTLRQQTLLMASGDFPVLIQGESGTGKEIVAHAIHNNSARRGETLITINCGAIPHHLEEAEFFGYSKGAFTGAYTNKLGIMQSADKSTVFLDEIGELSLAVQAKLLRVLDTGEFTRIGEVSPHKVDIRIISATNRDLEQMVEQGTFRKDLFFRLKGAVITTRPLAEHPEDIPYLVRHFISNAGAKKQVTRDAMQILSGYHWPGNIRELMHTVHHLCTASAASKRINSEAVKGVLKIEDAGGGADMPFQRARREFERTYFEGLLKKHHGNICRVAKEAQLHRPNLLRKLKDLDISPDSYRLKES